MKNNNHTQGEWHLDKYAYNITCKTQGTEIKIATLAECKEREVNAKIIIKAVNNHRPLVDTLDSIMNALSYVEKNNIPDKLWKKATSLLQSIEQQ